jgi:hypothetical protein
MMPTSLMMTIPKMPMTKKNSIGIRIKRPRKRKIIKREQYAPLVVMDLAQDAAEATVDAVAEEELQPPFI